MAKPPEPFETLPPDLARGLFDEVQRLTVLDGTSQATIRKAVVRTKGWALAPMVEELNRQEAKRLSIACQRWSYREAFCLRIDRFSAPETYRFWLTEDLLGKVHEHYPSPSYAIIETSRNFLFVSDGDYYWELAGNRSFLEAAAGKRMADIISDFGKVARGYKSPNMTGGRSILLSILQEATEIANESAS